MRLFFLTLIIFLGLSLSCGSNKATGDKPTTGFPHPTGYIADFSKLILSAYIPIEAQPFIEVDVIADRKTFVGWDSDAVLVTAAPNRRVSILSGLVGGLYYDITDPIFATAFTETRMAPLQDGAINTTIGAFLGDVVLVVLPHPEFTTNGMIWIPGPSDPKSMGVNFALGQNPPPGQLSQPFTPISGRALVE